MEQKRILDRRNKGGRPKKGAAGKLKYRLTVKMATSDYYTLKGKARSAGMSAGEFLRGCMRDSQVKERLTPEHTGYIRQLCGMANNLNQLAHKANAAGFATVRMECRVLVARIEELLNLILLSKCAKLIYTISGLESLAVALILGGGKPRPYSVGIISP